MSLDILISKYLDGELSNTEDNTLRDMISSDCVNKDTFDAHIELHHLLRNDAESIKVPQDLLSDTEDLIMMRIFAAGANVTPITAKPKRKLFAFRNIASAAAVLFLIFNVSIISDLPVGGFNLLSTNQNDIPVEFKQANNFSTNQANDKINSTKNSEFAAIDNLRIDAKSNPASITEEANIPLAIADLKEEILADELGPINHEDNTINPILSTQSKVTNGFESAVYNSSYNNNQIPVVNLQMGNDSPFDIKIGATSEVRLSSFIGNEKLVAPLDKFDGRINSSFSQSVSYALDSKSRFGFEVGMNEFDFRETVYLTLSNNELGSTGSKVEVLDPRDNLIKVPTRIEKVNYMFWGSAFYEKEIVQIDDFTLQARIGAGASNMGLLGYSRVYARYQVLNFASINIGFDSRFFKASFGINENTQQIWMNSYGLVYGVQFNF